MAEQDRRQLKIKTGSVVRLKKELLLYVKERDREQQRVNDLKQGGADVHDIKHAASSRNPSSTCSHLWLAACFRRWQQAHSPKLVPTTTASQFRQRPLA